jgi:peptidyl-prolyl cis-trans isomerase D
VLKVLRKRQSAVVIKVIFAMIVIVFVFWGIGAGLADRGQFVAKVNDDVITEPEYQRVKENLYRSYRDLSPKGLPDEIIQSQALDQLITTRLLSQEAQRLGFEATDEELRASIAAIPGFQVEGRFDKDTYLRMLQANRLKPQQFEALQRVQLQVEKLQDVVSAGALVTAAEVKDRYRHDNEKVNLRYVKIEAAKLEPGVTVADGDLQTYFDAHKEDFREPERARIEYLLFDPQTYVAQVQVPDDEIQGYYDSNQDDFRKREEVRARHILFKVTPGASPTDRDAARQRASDALKQLEGGADFAELAKQQSQDSTAPAGGDLGWFSRGQMVPAFEKAAFGLAVGAMSEVVETPFGFHIVKVEEKQPERVQPLEEVRPAVVQAVQMQHARTLAQQASEKAHEKLQDEKPIAEVAKEIGLTVQAPPPFAKTEPVVGLPLDPALSDAVFQADSGEVGDIVTLPNGYVIFRVTERIDSFLPELSVVREKVEAAARRERARALAKERGEALLKKLQESKDLDALAAAEGLKVDETGPVTRAGGSLPGIGVAAGLKDAAFALTPEAAVAPGAYESNGDVFLVVLKERIPADEGKFAEQEKMLTEQARRRLEGAVSQQFINYLKSQAKIEISPGYGGG